MDDVGLLSWSVLISAFVAEDNKTTKLVSDNRTDNRTTEIPVNPPTYRSNRLKMPQIAL